MNSSYLSGPLLLSACVLCLHVMVGRAATTNVFMNGSTFNPIVVNVKVGDTVTWLNQSGSHTATGSGSDPTCGNGSIPLSCAVTFNTAGSFPYFCIFHAGLNMTGLVVVAAANVAPMVSISTPTNGVKFFAGTLFPLTFFANDTDGAVTCPSAGWSPRRVRSSRKWD